MTKTPTLEVEIKFPVADPTEIESRLVALAVEKPENRWDKDSYFNAPDRDFARTDEAFRLRRIGPRNFVTYKGPKRDPRTKTRLEIEVPLADGDDAADGFVRLVQALGYRFTAEVSKSRRIYHFKWADFDAEVCLDDVDKVGTYVELEIIAPEPTEQEAREAVMQLAKRLGLEKSERRSYLELLLEARDRAT
jgi:adenylate cyclase class 2